MCRAFARMPDFIINIRYKYKAASAYKPRNIYVAIIILIKIRCNTNNLIGYNRSITVLNKPEMPKAKIIH